MAVNRFSCPGCQTTLKITTPELVGKKIRCPKCATITVVPGAEPPAQPKPEPKLEPAAAQISRTDEDEIAAMLAGSGWEDQPEEPPTKDVVAAPASALDEAAFEEEPPTIKRPARMEEEDEDVEPREPAKPPEKKRGGKVLAILVAVVVFGYLGALGATLFGMFDEKPGPEMSKEEAFKVLADTMRGRKR